MHTSTLYLIAADAVLALHVAFVAFVVLGLVLVLAGKLRGWSWIRNPWFRLAHLIAIGIVVLQSWLGVLCPLTMLEMELRARGGGDVYSGSFIGHWLESVLYYDVPAWVFVVAYSTFGALVLASWFWVRPRRFRKAA